MVRILVYLGEMFDLNMGPRRGTDDAAYLTWLPVMDKYEIFSIVCVHFSQMKPS